MKAALTGSDARTAVVTSKDPEKIPGHAIVEVVATGVCGTDRHIIARDFPAQLPRILGHEISGRVAWIDSEASAIAVGTGVAIDPNMPCYQCTRCRHGAVHLCARRRAIGIDLDGGFAELVRVPVAQLYPLAPHVAPEHGVLAEPLSCCLRGLERLRNPLGWRVAIVGLGPIGALLGQLLHKNGSADLVGFEASGERRALAEVEGMNARPWEDRLSWVSPDSAFDVVVDAVGSGAVFEWAIQAVRSGGTILLFGVANPQDRASISPYEIYRKEITVVSAYTNPFTMQQAITLLNHGMIDVARILTDPIVLEELPLRLKNPGKVGRKLFVKF